MSTTEQFYDRLAAAASLEGDDAAVRMTATYEPAAGPGTKVSPPTYPAPDAPRNASDPYSPYVIEDRVAPDGSTQKCVLLDSRQSQANRCEEALQGAIYDGRLSLPHLVLELETHGTQVTITSLTAPHRSRDAYFRDALGLDGTRFDETDAGKRLLAGEASAYYASAPADLVYGVWDSHRKRRIQTKFPRVYTSEIVGLGTQVGTRMAGRYDLLTGAANVTGGDMDWQLTEKGGTKVSEIGLGPIPPQRGPGGVTVEAIHRDATLSFAGLARLPLGDAATSRAGRAVLGALALLGDRLAFGSPAVFLRSGCDLVLTDERMSWVGRRGEDPFELSRADALALFQIAVDRAASAGLTWVDEPVRLRPMEKLQALVDKVFLTSPEEGE